MRNSSQWELVPLLRIIVEWINTKSRLFFSLYMHHLILKMFYFCIAPLPPKLTVMFWECLGRTLLLPPGRCELSEAVEPRVLERPSQSVWTPPGTRMNHPGTSEKGHWSWGSLSVLG